ncbi:MAG: nuclear transport factor 2 family protein [Burkholderiales bacterium]
MSPIEIVERFARAAESADGSALARCFTADGVYHDGFYGAFHGPSGIRAFLEEYVYRDSERMRWTYSDIAGSGNLIYAKYLFSYSSKLAGKEGQRVHFQGVSQFRMKGDLIERYWEVFDSGMALAQLDFAPERIRKVLSRANEAFLRTVPADH